MSRAALIGAVLVTLLSFGPGVGADEATISPSPTGYYTKTQDPFRTVSGPVGDAACDIPSPDPRTCVNPAQLTGGTPGYPRQDNYVYVATINGEDDAHGVIAIPLFSVPLGSKISSLVLDFYVENEPSAGTLNFDPDSPAMQFCLITEGWAGQDGAPYESQPDTNCEIRAEPKKIKEEERTETTDEGAPVTVSLVLYRVDLMPMAREWAKGTENNGVMVRPTPDAPSISQTAIRTPGVARDGMQVKVSYTAPALTPPPTVEQPPAANAPTFAEPEAEVSDPEPSFEVAEPEPTTVDGPIAARPVSVTTPWWTYLAIPLGMAGLAGLGRGTNAPIRSTGGRRAGPVSRLMDRASMQRGGRD